VETLTAVEPGDGPMRVNDGRTDREGNFVFGTLNERPGHPPTGSFYQFSIAHGLRRLALPPAAIPNSICFSLDGRTMYYCDSPAGCIMQCHYEAGSARVEGIRRFASLPEGGGSPDGSTVDADGCLWNAIWGAARVTRYRPNGEVDRLILIPAKNPTSAVFGGPTYQRLYVTSARQEMRPEELARVPESGGLFVAAPGVSGVPDALFRDDPRP
jgi:sugar lactone lactonase YvrE